MGVQKIERLENRVIVLKKEMGVREIGFLRSGLGTNIKIYLK